MKEKRNKILRLIWILFPIPFGNIIIPIVLLVLYVTNISSLISIIFFQKTFGDFPSTSQVEFYGIDFYQSLFLSTLLLCILSTAIWLGNFIFLSFIQKKRILLPSVKATIGAGVLIVLASTASFLVTILAIVNIAPV